MCSRQRRLVRYFDLQAASRLTMPKGQAAVRGKLLPVLPQYAALILGIAVQPYLTMFQLSGHWQLTGWPQWLAFAAIVGIIVFPGVYKRSIDPGKPLFVQLCVIFSAGIGWQSLFTTAGKALPH